MKHKNKINDFTLKTYTNFTAVEALGKAVESHNDLGGAITRNLKSGDICAFSTLGTVWEATRPKRWAEVLGDVLVESYENLGKTPYLVFYQHEDDVDEDYTKIINTAYSAYLFGTKELTKGLGVYVMGVVSDELNDEEKPNNDIEAESIGALVVPRRFAMTDIVISS